MKYSRKQVTNEEEKFLFEKIFTSKQNICQINCLLLVVTLLNDFIVAIIVNFV